MRPSRLLREAARRPVAVRVVTEPVKRPLFVADREWWMLVTSALAAGAVIALFAGALAGLYGLIPWSVVLTITALYVLPAIGGFVAAVLPGRLVRNRGTLAKRIAFRLLIALVLFAVVGLFALTIVGALRGDPFWVNH